MNTEPTILIVDDDKDILTAAKLLLKRPFGTVLTCDQPVQLDELMQTHTIDAILLDMNFSPGDSSGAEGLHWLQHILTLDPDAVVVMVTAHAGVNLAVQAMQHGATDFIAKPWQNEKMIATVSSALALRASRKEARQLRLSNKALTHASTPAHHILGNSDELKTVLSLIDRAAPTDANVLIVGENGTGKELAARAVHDRSERKDQVFMAIDLGTIAENLFESELFGHVKGAFSGANEHRVGRLLAAHKGTLFLDEIGNIPLALQAKLLTVLEQREVTPVGSNKPQKFDVRVVAATNMSREQLYGGKVFREDLLFRLNTVEIALPPLHKRLGDLSDIAQYYAELYAKKYRKPIRMLSDAALAAAKQYIWPGNVRELRHSIERAVILAEGSALEAKDLQLRSVSFTINSEKEKEIKPEAEHAHPPAEGSLNLEQLEYAAINEALEKHSYNISRTAKELGLTRAALYRRMEKHGL